jgi:sigma-B regulation protein RsbU (phosphoserine phosphatase)
MHWAVERVCEPRFVTYLEELVNRFAMALDNVRLFAAATSERQHAREEAAFAERMVAIVSHDLRNPLTAIRLASRVIASKALAPEHQPPAQLIVRSSERMMRLIGQLLNFARLHRGMSLPMTFESAHLHQIANRIVDEVRHASPGADIRIVLVGRDDLTCDIVGVEAILSNLLYNAIQHGTKGPITISVREGSAENIEIDVHNVGPAIPDDVQATMFEAFRQGAATGSSAAAKGVGLGLYITREVLRAHGGTINVHSPDRNGTTFSVSLPRYPRVRAELEEPVVRH